MNPVRNWSLALVLVVAPLVLVAGCPEGGDNFNGTVTLNDEPAEGVQIEIRTSQDQFDRPVTDASGNYSALLTNDPAFGGNLTFTVMPTGMGLPDDAECVPPSIMVNIVDDAPSPARGDFACTGTPGMEGMGGAGGAGGNAGTGGTGGSGNAESPYRDCVERPPGSVACECDPFDDNCSGNLNCSISFFVDELDLGVITSVPALDGSECCPATECISDFIQTVGENGACNITLTGTLRRDDCLPGLFCDFDGLMETRTCVPLCVNNSDCADGSCEFLSLTNTDLGPLGRCRR